MAKRASRQESSESAEEASGSAGSVTVAEHKIEEFAEDLGRLLGTARAKAEGWIGQRQTITQHLQDIRDTASNLLTQLSGATAGKRRGRPARSAAPTAEGELAPAPKSKK